ncbi:flavin reductase family protein [Halomonas salifodinae]|uniref:Flavin reductase family protein n=1 Tax=Halomonas salifodinae TaxID=438745 RepID=A0ABW2EQQ4_9GAMM
MGVAAGRQDHDDGGLGEGDQQVADGLAIVQVGGLTVHQEDVDGRPKDTIRNLGQVPECVVHISGEGLVEKMNATSAGLPHHEDEFDHVGLEKVAMPGVSVPLVVGAPVAFGCRLREIIRFGDLPLAGNLVLAEVVSLHVDDAIWNGRHVSVEALRPIGRMAGNDYARTTDLFAVERPASGSALSRQERGG